MRNYWGSIGLNPAASTAKNKTQCARGLLAGTGESELLGVRKVRFCNKRVCVLLRKNSQTRMCLVTGLNKRVCVCYAKCAKRECVQNVCRMCVECVWYTM